MSDLIKRLRGKYSVGPEGVYEDRDFGSFTPQICSEAADRIEELEKELEDRKEEYKTLTIKLEVDAIGVFRRTMEVNRELKEEIEALKQPWISVNDKKPTPGELVLLKIRLDDDQVRMTTGFFDLDDDLCLGSRIEYEYAFKLGINLDDVVGWKPLEAIK